MIFAVFGRWIRTMRWRRRRIPVSSESTPPTASISSNVVIEAGIEIEDSDAPEINLIAVLEKNTYCQAYQPGPGNEVVLQANITSPLSINCAAKFLQIGARGDPQRPSFRLWNESIKGYIGLQHDYFTIVDDEGQSCVFTSDNHKIKIACTNTYMAVKDSMIVGASGCQYKILGTSDSQDATDFNIPVIQ